MAIFLSPGVYPREIDLSLTPQSQGPLRPVFIGTSQKGPMNTPTFIDGAQAALDTFGEPFSDSYLMYAVLSYLEEGGSCYIIRVGVEYIEGQDDALDDICIDTSGTKIKGWGRIPVFTGIDFGKINLRAVSTEAPCTFHNASVSSVTFNDASLSATDGATDATLDFTGTDLSSDYTGCIDDSFVMLITGNPSVGETMDGATYVVIRNSDGTYVSEGTLVDTAGNSQVIDIGSGLAFKLTLVDGNLAKNDTFSFEAYPNNRLFTVEIDGVASASLMMPAATYSTNATLVAAIDALLGAEDFQCVEYTDEDDVTVPRLITTVAGQRIQVTGTCAWADEVGIDQYEYDIPRGFLIGTAAGPYNITTSNNRLKMKVIGDTTKEIEFNIPTGSGQDADDLASVINVAGNVAGEQYFISYALTVPGGLEHVVIEASPDHQLDIVQMMANYTNIKTLKFSEALAFLPPYKAGYRGYSDTRLELPEGSSTDPAIPQSCEDDPLSSQCALDSAYYANIVGYFVATSPGTWIDSNTLTLDMFTEGFGSVSGRYKLTIKDANGAVIDGVQDFTFDPSDDRFIANLINPGSSLGGQNGNDYVNWESRPSYLANDPDSSDFEARNPSLMSNKAFDGTANGIPTDPSYSNELDAAVIGNASDNSGLYGVQNAETIDINMIVTPGFTTGAVIGNALQICENRGDAIYLVDPPFGLRPQQVVDWHNGMLVSDLASAINSSYGALYHSWLKIFDQFNREEIWVPPSGHVASVFSRTARVAEQWSAPAGLRRGRILTALDIEYSPSVEERNLLYGSGNAVNPIVKFPQEGIVVYGQRTLQRADTALDRVSTRMLLTHMKKNLISLLRNFIFEPNDAITWSQAQNAIEPFMADLQARRGVESYQIIIDSRNNTPARRDRHELWVSILFKPVGVIEFVALNLTVLQSAQSFQADEVLAAAGIVNRSGASLINP